MVLLPLLLLPAIVVAFYSNVCGSLVSEYRNLDMSVNVSLELVADMVLDSPGRFKDLYDFDISLFKTSVTNVSIGNWTMWYGDRVRDISYHVAGEYPLLVEQKQTISDQKRTVEIYTDIRLVDFVINTEMFGKQPVAVDFYIKSWTCVSPGTRYEVDVLFNLPNENPELIAKMKKIVNATEKALKKLELVHQNYEHEFKFDDTIPQSSSRYQRHSGDDYLTVVLVFLIFIYILMVLYSCAL